MEVYFLMTHVLFQDPLDSKFKLPGQAMSFMKVGIVKDLGTLYM